MFSKAKLKRFNEEVGCAPPPTKYDVKPNECVSGGSLDKSGRWKDFTNNVPAPNAYSISNPSTPRNASIHSKLNVSTCSSDSASSQGTFISPPKYFSRSKSFKNTRVKEHRESELKLRVDTLIKENEELRTSLHQLQLSTSLSGSSLCEKEICHSAVQVDASCEENSCGTQTESSMVDLEAKNEGAVSLPKDEFDLLKDHVDHLTLLRDNLEQSVAHKDELIADLHEQIDVVVSDAQEHQEKAENLSMEVCQVQKQLEDTFGKKLEAESKVKELIAKYEAIVSERKEEVRKNKDIIAQKDIEIELLNDSVSTLNTQVSEYEKAVKRTQAEISLRLLQISSLEMTVGDLSIATKEKEVMETVLEDELKEKNIEMTKLERSLEDVETKVVDVIRDRDKLSSELQEEKDKTTRLTTKVTEYEVKIKEQEVLQQFLEKEISSREAEIMELNEKLDKIIEDCEMARKVALDLHKEAETKMNKIFCLEASLSAKDYDLDAKEDQLSTLKDEICQKASELQKERDAFNRTNSEEMIKLEEALKKEKESTEELQEKLVHLMAEISDREDEYKKKVLEKDSELEELSVKYSDALLDQEAAKRILSCTSDELGNVKLILQATEREMNSLKSKIDETRQEKDNLEGSIKELAVKLSHLEDALACEEAESREMQVKLQKKLKIAHDNISKFERENTELKTSNEAFMARITHMRIDMEKKAMAIVEMQQCIEMLREEKAQLNSIVNARDSALREKEDLLSNLQEEFENKLCSVTSLQDNIQRKQEEIYSLENSLRGKATEIVSFEGKLSSLEEKFSLVDLQLDQEAKEKSAYRVKVLELEERLKETDSEHEKSFACLTSQIEEKDRTISDLANEVHNLKAKYEGYQDMLANLQSSLLEKTSIAERLESTFHEVNTKLENQSQSFEQLQEEKENLLKESFLLKENLTTKENLLEELNNSVTALNQEVVHLQQEIKKKEQKEASFEVALKEIQNSLNSFCPEEISSSISHDSLLKRIKAEICRSHETRKILESRLEELNSLHQCELEDLRKLNLNLQEETDTWRSKFEYLEQMIEPFREQLDAFELERSALLNTTSAAQEEVNKLSQEYVKLLGHQNHKQKIQHILKLKNENNDLRQDVQKLRCEIEKQKKSLKRMEERIDKPSMQAKSKSFVAQKGNKENNANLAASTIGGQPGTQQVATATPLRASNRLHRI